MATGDVNLKCGQLIGQLIGLLARELGMELF